MTSSSHRILGGVASFLLGSWLFVSAPLVLAQDADNPSGLKILYQDSLSKITTTKTEKQGQIFNSYAAMMERLAVEYQQKADLDGLIKAKAEAEAAKQHKLLATPFPDAAAYRAKLREAVVAIDNEALEETLRLDNAYVSKMEAFRVKAVQSGDLDVAIMIDNEVKEVKARMAGYPQPQTAKAPTNSTDQTPIVMSGTAVTNSKLLESPIEDEIKLESGIHRLDKQKTVVGNREVPQGEKAIRGFITIPSNTTIENGEIYIDVGEVHAEKSRFKDIKFSANLGSRLEATDCLFDNSSIVKGGGWFSGFSSRWVLENCVFRGVFIGNNNFNRRSIGLEVTDCTFIDVTFPPLEYEEDPVEESQHEWRTLEDCHFIRCTLPDSVLAMTKDCSFEDCTFVRDPKPPTIADGRQTVTLFYSEGASFAPPPRYGNTQFQVKDGTEIRPRPGQGSSLSYHVTATMLDFR